MLKLLLGDPNTRKLKRYQPIVEEINFFEQEISQLTDDELRTETSTLKSKISSELDLKKQKQLLDEFLPKSFAIVREASKRVLDMRHFDVQLIGGMVLNECQIAEMKIIWLFLSLQFKYLSRLFLNNSRDKSFLHSVVTH